MTIASHPGWFNLAKRNREQMIDHLLPVVNIPV
jgi:hypothetical protein